MADLALEIADLKDRLDKLVAEQAQEAPAPVPPEAVQAAANAHALMGHAVKLFTAAQAEVEKFVPAELLDLAEAGLGNLLKGIL